MERGLAVLGLCEARLPEGEEEVPVSVYKDPGRDMRQASGGRGDALVWAERTEDRLSLLPCSRTPQLAILRIHPDHEHLHTIVPCLTLKRSSLPQELYKSLSRSLDDRATLRWAADILRALRSLAALGLPHHGLRPEAVFAADDGGALVAPPALPLEVRRRFASLAPELFPLSPLFQSPEEILSGEEGVEGEAPGPFIRGSWLICTDMCIA